LQYSEVVLSLLGRTPQKPGLVDGSAYLQSKDSNSNPRQSNLRPLIQTQGGAIRSDRRSYGHQDCFSPSEIENGGGAIEE